MNFDSNLEYNTPIRSRACYEEHRRLVERESSLPSNVHRSFIQDVVAKSDQKRDQY